MKKMACGSIQEILMALQGRVQAPAGLIGFDTTDRLNPATAKQYFNKYIAIVFVTSATTKT
jgi:hypothetical protein